LPDSVTQIWNLALVHPIEGALLWLTELTGSAGWAIILFTFIIRTAMLPLSLQQIKSQKAMMALQPRLRELQQRYAGDRSRMGQEQIRLYKEAGVNPAAGCLPMLIQLPIWFALYSSLINLSHRSVEADAPEAVRAFSHGFLWIQNLAALSTPDFNDPSTWPLVILPVLTAITQWIVQKMSTMPTTDPQQQQMNRMMEFMPFMFLMFSFQVAAGLTLYWVVSNLYSIVQQRFAVGWGSLPFLGSSGPPAGGGTPAVPNGGGPNGRGPNGQAVSPSRPRPSPTRRRSSSSRRRRGK
jgi:YidC/Oxa1 family membrane protein insertase